MMSHKRSFVLTACLAACLCALAPRAKATDGYFVQGFGAVNSSLGGAGTAGNDEDLIGSIYKNPANAVLFPDRTASVVFGDIIPSVRTDSSVAGLGLSGSSKSTIGGVPYLSLMASWKAVDPSLTWFAGAVSEAGLSFHSPESFTNPIFFPQAGAANNPFGGLFGGFGDVRSSLYVIRIPIGVAGKTKDGWSWGINLAPSIGRGLFTPAAYAPPGFGANFHPIYGTVQQQDIEFGMGVQGGLRFRVDKDLSLGLSLSSPTWFQSYSWTITDPSGTSRTVSFKLNRPLTAQIGFNYAIGPSTQLLGDVGYTAYGSTSGFEGSGYLATGAVAGLGWKDSYTAEIGIQHQLNSSLILRAGYNYSSDPIPVSNTFYNVGSPLHLEQNLSLGASIILAPNTTIDLSYTRGLSHTQSSAWYNPYGAVPGTTLTSEVSGNEFAIGTTFRF